MIRKAVSQAMPGLRRPGRAFRLAAGLVRAVAVELVVGRAILARANQIALFALSDRVPAALERLLPCPGCVDGRPTDMLDTGYYSALAARQPLAWRLMHPRGGFRFGPAALRGVHRVNAS